MGRVIITGANGSGKSHFAKRLSEARPDLPLYSFDAVKLTTNWQTRPREEIDQDLSRLVDTPSWILEGGPSLLPIALPPADAVVWLNPSFATRAWRLARRPWQHLGQTRPELPAGNPDQLGMQYRFALKSLRKEKSFRNQIAGELRGAKHAQIFTCSNRSDIAAALGALGTGS